MTAILGVIVQDYKLKYTSFHSFRQSAIVDRKLRWLGNKEVASRSSN